MSSKTKHVISEGKAPGANVARKARTPAKRSVTKVQTAVKNDVGKAKPSADSTTKKVSAKAKVHGKKPAGFVQNIKESIHTGIEAVGAFFQKITPDALLPDSAKSKGT